MVDVKKLIEKQRAELEVIKSSDVDVVLGGETVSLTIDKAHPDEWDALMGSNPPRPGIDADGLVGYNPKGVTRAYPRVQADGEVLDAETWAELFDVLDSVFRNAVEVTIWGVNVNQSLQALRELGKARAGLKSDLPAN